MVKRIPISKLKALAQENVVTIPWSEFCGEPDIEADVEQINVVIKRRLPLADVLQFSNDIVESCLPSSTGEYTPEILDFVIKLNLLARYANFNVPHSVERQYDLIYNTDVVSKIYEVIDKEQLSEIVQAAEKKINYLLGGENSYIASQMAHLVESMSKLNEMSDLLLQGVDPDAMSNVIDMVGNTSLDDLTKSIINAQHELDKTKGDKSREN